ncbi:phage tail protein [Providencia alcalifaciens]|nr:phage tail protein [Providencia alcalifaciens]MTC64981.1 phage tail protein [Providencia alcalifaciens]
MPTVPNPLAPVKGAGTTLWIYTGDEEQITDPLSETGFTRLGKVKELQPGEITAASEDDSYLDDPNGDWENTTQGEKSSGEASITLAWKPGEEGQKDLVKWFDSGASRFYKIAYPNGTVDLFKGWVSGLGKTIPIKETITRTVKIKNTGRPTLAEEIPPKPEGKTVTQPKG